MNNAKFYWDVVTPCILDSMRYLPVPQEEKLWVATLHVNVPAALDGNTAGEI